MDKSSVVLYVIPALAFLFLIVVAALIGSVAYTLRTLRKRQDAILARESPGLAGKTWFRVHVSDEARFRRLIKFLPLQYSGILVLDADEIRLQVESAKGQSLRRTWSLRDARPEWIGNSTWGSGNMQWFALGRGESRLYLTADSGLNAYASRRATADVYQHIVGAGVPFAGQREFALERNPASLAILIVMAVLMLITAIEFFVNDERLITRSWLPIAALVGVALCTGLALVLVRSRVPVRESIVLAYLLCIVLHIAEPGIAKLIDRATATGEMQSYEFVRTKGTTGKFEPLDKSLPQLDLPGGREYWAEIKPGDHRNFLLRQGGLRLWQIDFAPVAKEIREFYDGRDRKQEKAQTKRDQTRDS